MTPSALASVDRLRDLLTSLGDALATGRIDAVLAAELPLVDAVRGLPVGDLGLPAEERRQMRALIAETRTALVRCRRLGEVASDLAACLAMPIYGRSGAVRPGMTPAAFQSRT